MKLNPEVLLELNLSDVAAFEYRGDDGNEVRVAAVVTGVVRSSTDGTPVATVVVQSLEDLREYRLYTDPERNRPLIEYGNQFRIAYNLRTLNDYLLCYVLDDVFDGLPRNRMAATEALIHVLQRVNRLDKFFTKE